MTIAFILMVSHFTNSDTDYKKQKKIEPISKLRNSKMNVCGVSQCESLYPNLRVDSE